MITDTEFKKRFDKFANIDVTTFLEDAKSIAFSIISNRYNNLKPMETDIELVVERCVYDLTNVLLLRRSAANLNDQGLTDLYNQTMKILKDISNGNIISGIVPIIPPELNTPSTSITIMSQQGYYNDEYK